jgi:predicted alpha/beta-hydrolase family hydrolase
VPSRGDATTVTFPDGAAGSVSGAITPASEPRTDTVVILAHGAGNDMTSAFLVEVAARLAQHGVATVRFNFPYKEHGGRAPDPAPVLETCYRAVVADVRRRLQPRRLIIGGKSMGGRMASHLAAAGEPIDGLLFLGYPLHPAGRPDKLRVAHLPRITAPMLFLTGTRDALCRLDLLQAALADLPTATLHVVDDADHSFVVRRRSGRDHAAVLDEIVHTSLEWLRRLPARGEGAT